MKIVLSILFSAIFVCMAVLTTLATIDRGVVTAARELWPDWWFRATLADAYFGFLTFYVWVAYKEATWAGRVLWFVSIMLLGNFAMSAYVLWQLYTSGRQANFEQLLLRGAPARAQR